MIEAFVNQNEISKLDKILNNRIAFGTAGLRGPMGPGYTSMNELVILQTTQGLCEYLESQHGIDCKKQVFLKLSLLYLTIYRGPSVRI